MVGQVLIEANFLLCLWHISRRASLTILIHTKAHHFITNHTKAYHFITDTLAYPSIPYHTIPYHNITTGYECSAKSRSAVGQAISTQYPLSSSACQNSNMCPICQSLKLPKYIFSNMLSWNILTNKFTPPPLNLGYMHTHARILVNFQQASKNKRIEELSIKWHKCSRHRPSQCIAMLRDCAGLKFLRASVVQAFVVYLGELKGGLKVFWT